MGLLYKRLNLMHVHFYRAAQTLLYSGRSGVINFQTIFRIRQIQIYTKVNTNRNIRVFLNDTIKRMQYWYLLNVVFYSITIYNVEKNVPVTRIYKGTTFDLETVCLKTKLHIKVQRYLFKALS